jgi:putative membrane-bound dehydrogenase-like protein
MISSPLGSFPRRVRRAGSPRGWIVLCAAMLATSVGRAAEWRTVTVPGLAEVDSTAAATTRSAAFDTDGGSFAWYRAWVKVHDSFFTKHERNLFEESVSVNLRDVADAHEVFANGVSLGRGGEFPPAFRSGRGEIHRHKVPVGTLRKGEWNEIAVRVYRRGGAGGFAGEAPFVMNYFMECVLAGPWEFTRDADAGPGPARTERPATAAFDQFRESSGVLGRAAQNVTGPKLPPAESLAKLRTAPDLAVDQLLSEPLVAQPTHLSYDERGRLWVTQYRQYPYPAGLRMVSRDKYYRSHYDRVPPPPPHHDRGADVISIHEDTDGDGVYDRHKVFQDGLNMANAAVRGRGGVWVMHPPYLLFYPDADFDDVPDGPPEVRLQGFGLEDTHSVANGLVWGPDGWLYGGQGSTTSSRVTRPGLDAPDAAGVYFEGCMVWRYHPETRAFEIFAEGSGNTFGLEVDADGRLYSGHNGGQTRGWHYVQGGFYLMQGVEPGKFGPPRHPFAFGDLPMMRALNPVQRFSHFGAFAEGTALPAAYRGRLFALDPLRNEVLDVERRPRGATFETRDAGRVLWSEDVAFRPLFIVNAPDGSLHVSDMYEYYIAHGQHYQSQIDPTTGRVYRLRGRDAVLERDTNLAAKTTAQLVALLAHPNKWHRATAARVLGERADPAAVAALRAVVAAGGGDGALAALWALRQMGRDDEAVALAALRHPHASVRAWAVRGLGDRHGASRGLHLPAVGAAVAATGLPAATAAALVTLAAEEPVAEVRAQLAATARRLPTAQALAVADPLLRRDGDTDDAYLPLLLWWVLEPHLALDRAAVLGLFGDRTLWDGTLVQRHILPRLMRRFAVTGRLEDLREAAGLLRLAPSPAEAAQLMRGFEEAFRGRPMTGLPDELLAAMRAAGQAPLAVRLRQGEAAAIAEVLALVRNPKARADERLLYVGLLGEVRPSGAPAVLREIAASTAATPLRKAALVALQSDETPDLGAWAMGLWPKAGVELRTTLLALTASRAGWSAALLDAVERGAPAAGDVPANIVDRLRAHAGDPALAARVARMFPAAAPAGAGEFEREIGRVAAALRAGSGDPYRGEATFLERCASCHTLFFKGGKVGPDLTPYQRDHLGTMLLSIINPDAEIREGFQYVIVETTDGRSLSGFPVERDPQVVVLRGLEGADFTLRHGEIKALRPVGRSLMPAGLLGGLTDQQLRDFFAYLRISQPITR